MTVLTPYRKGDGVTVYAGDSFDVLRTLASNSVDAVVTDPPYGLAPLPQSKIITTLTAWLTGDTSYVPATGRGFQGMAWDRFVPPPALWAEALRVLKPGGYLATFAGTRTQDLMGLSIRLSGFRLVDQLHWIRADSFAKTRHSTKPGYEPIILAQKPTEGTIAANLARWGTGGLNIEACRVPFASDADERESKTKNQHTDFGTPQGGNTVYGRFTNGTVKTNYDAPGRWPTNLLLDPDAAVELKSRNPRSTSRRSAPRQGAADAGWGTTHSGAEYDDEGGPSRFYPKVFYAGRASAKERPVAPDGTTHPTPKPLSVMDWLITLVTPADGTVLDPFLGSGSTAEAARAAGFTVIGVEGHLPYLPLIDVRLDRRLT